MMHWTCTSRNAYRIVLAKLLGDWPLGSPKEKWEEIFEWLLSGIACKYVNWIELVQNHIMVDFHLNSFEISSSFIVVCVLLYDSEA